MGANASIRDRSLVVGEYTGDPCEAATSPLVRGGGGHAGPGAADVRVSVVVPTLDEADNIPHVLARLPEDLDEVILVDGHSVDDTVAIAIAIRPSVRVVMAPRRGKGAAIAAGFAAARGTIIVMIDADGSNDPAEIPLFVAALMAGADFAKGSRFMPGGRSADITLVRRLGNTALNRAVNGLFGTTYTDLCYGFNAIWARHVATLDVNCDGFEVETLMNIRAARAGLAVVEVPSFEHERLSGASKLSAWRDGRRVLRTIVRERFSTRGVQARPSLTA
jgi:glycosyltransferase involved in cell wall biosynthesis